VQNGFDKVFGHFCPEIYKIKNWSHSKCQLDTQSVRDIDPSRSKRCDGKSISFRQGVTLKHCSEPYGREATAIAAVNGQHSVYNADSSLSSETVNKFYSNVSLFFTVTNIAMT